MGDAAEPWRAMRNHQQQSNAKRYARSVAQLALYPYRVQQFAHGTHWRVEIDGILIDFWPHTGRYHDARAPKRMHGTALDFDDFIRRLTRRAR